MNPQLLTPEIAALIPPLYHYEQTNQPPIATVKFFDPAGSWTWYVAEGEKQPDGDWLFWGAVDGFEFEYGYFTLRELETAKQGCTGIHALPIERDLYWKPVPLSELQGEPNDPETF